MDDEPTVRALEYPFDAPPAPGETLEVADGIHWLRMPLPFRLDHINLYLLADRDGWVIVDTGIRGRTTRAHWEQVLGGLLAGAPVKRIIATHMHPDHVGQAGWLTRRTGARLWMTRTEFIMCKMLSLDGPADVPEDAIAFYRRAGFDRHQLEVYEQRFGRFGAMIEPLPAGFERLEDGQRIDIGGTDFEVVVGCGHSPEHACLYSSERAILLSGDQVLPRISSNVSVFPTEPSANPLHDWLVSCRTLPSRLPDDVLVLPSHNEPFRGLHRRFEALVAGHVAGLERLHALCDTPRRIVDLFPALFRNEVTDEVMLLATGESVAHVNYLLGCGLLTESVDGDGVAWFESTGPFDSSALPEL